ncbi:MAG: glycosyltransferase [Chloroflexota bacterium]|jgi:D-inositol-3-phosphate glycosyltransferase
MIRKKGRVAMLSEHASPVALLGSEDAGGQNVYVDQVSRNVASLGYEVDVYTRCDDKQLPEEIQWAPGVRVVNLQAGPAHFIKKDPMWQHMPAFRDSLLDYMQRKRRSYDLIHANFWMSGWVACQIRPILAVPIVEIFHALGKIKRIHQGEADTSPEERVAVEYGVIDQVDRIIAQCPNEMQELVALYDADPSKIEVIPSAVDIETFKPVPRERARAELGLSPDERIALYVGRMLPRKGIDNVLDAFAMVASRTSEPVRLVIVGGETNDGDPMQTPEIRRLADKATELGIRHLVEFPGKRPQKALKSYYSAADVSISTPWYEPFGLTPLEAMACGTPVIGSDVGGIKFTVSDGETGFLVPARNPVALAERMHLLLLDTALGRRMGRAARARVERLFTWKKVGERTVDLYESLLRSRAERPYADDAVAAQTRPNGRGIVNSSAGAAKRRSLEGD